MDVETTPATTLQSRDHPYGLTFAEALWLAYKIARCRETNMVWDVRDLMRAIKSRWDQMGLPVDSWPMFEADVLHGGHPFSKHIEETMRGAIFLLAGNNHCPIGDLDRTK